MRAEGAGMVLTPQQAQYEESMTLGAARATFFARAGLGSDGGYGARWVRIEARPVPVFFPNTRCRVEAATLHDLHHVATEYATDWPGEAEIAAWEIAGGCGGYGWAWLLDLGAFTVGLLLAPRRVFDAFVRGRGARNLYHDGVANSGLDSMTVGTLRHRLGLRAPSRRARSSDVVAFIAWCAIGVVYHAAAIALGLAVVWSAWEALRR
jgi:hypothetical protein